MNTSALKNEYMLFFRGEHWDKGLSNEELEQVLQQVTSWMETLVKEGKVKATEALAPGGKMISAAGRTVSDRSLAESKEAVGGILLIRAKDIEEATAIAKSAPMLQYGISIEVRSIYEECPVFERARARLALASA